MLFLESHLSQLPSQPPSVTSLSVSQCPLFLSHPTVLPAIYAIKCHLCYTDVNQRDGADPLASQWDQAPRLKDNSTSVRFDSTWSTVCVPQLTINWLHLINPKIITYFQHDITRHLHGPLLPVCFSTYLLLPLLSRSLSPRLVALDHWLDENRPPHFFFFMLSRPSHHLFASPPLIKVPPQVPLLSLEIVRRSPQMLPPSPPDTISLILSQSPLISRRCPFRSRQWQSTRDEEE